MARTPLAPRRRARNVQTKKVINPGKGLNNLVSDNLVDDAEASDLLNIQYVEAGAVSKRNGYRQVANDLSNNPRGLGVYTPTSGTRYLVTVDGTTLKYTTSVTTNFSSATGSTFTADNAVTFTQARGLLYIWNGVEGGTTFDGSACARPGTMPKASFGLFYKSYHWVSGVAGQVNRLYISVATDASDFTNAATTLHNSTEVPGATVFAGTGAAFVDIDKDDGDAITGLATFQDSVIVFKKRSIHQITLDSSGTPTVVLITRSIGCASHRSIENVENDVFFLSRQGYFVLGNEPNFFNAVRTNEVSVRIHPTIDLISEANFSKVSSIFYNNRYYSGIPEGGATANNVVLTYDRRFLAWARNEFGAEAWTVYTDSNEVEHLCFTSSDSAKIFEIDNNYSDNGSAINSYWTSKAYDLGEFDLEKRWVDVTMLFRQISGTVTIQVFTDNDTLAASTTVEPSPTGGDMGTITLGLELLGGNADDQVSTTNNTTNIPYRLRISKNSRTVKLKISNNINNENFVLLGINWAFYPFSHFKFPSENKLF